jgi:hypothetical protein
MVSFKSLFFVTAAALSVVASPVAEPDVSVVEIRSETDSAVDLALREIALADVNVASRDTAKKLGGCSHGCSTYYDVVYALDSEVSGVIGQISQFIYLNMGDKNDRESTQIITSTEDPSKSKYLCSSLPNFTF